MFPVSTYSILQMFMPLEIPPGQMHMFPQAPPAFFHTMAPGGGGPGGEAPGIYGEEHSQALLFSFQIGPIYAVSTTIHQRNPLCQHLIH